LARDHPDLVRRLVVVSAAARLRDAGHAAQRSVIVHLRAGGPRRAAGAMLAATTRSPIRGAFLRVAGYLLGRVAVGYGDQDLIVTIEAENKFDLSDGLAQMSASTVIIGGSQDGYYSPEIFKGTANSILNAGYVELAKKGHVTAMTNRAVRTRSEPTSSADDHLRAPSMRCSRTSTALREAHTVAGRRPLV
jgi:pimeloyl-ACP methyl ester carboxylesterase